MSNPEQKLDPVNSDDDIVENEDDLEEEEDDDENYEDDDEGDLDRASPATRDGPEVAKARMESLFRRMQSGKVTLRVHDVIVKGNTKTKDYLIEAELEAIRNATSMREIIQAASIANYRLRELDCFDSVNITLDAGPPELPGTTNVIVEVEEIKSPVSGQIGTFTKGEVCVSFYL